MLSSAIKLRHLVCFLEVSRAKSVVKAAAVLGVSQPAVSKTIQELEEVLRVALFDRSRRSLVLTSFGEVFLRYASVSITALNHGVKAAEHAGEAETIGVTIGALPTVSARILPSAVAHFTHEGFGMRPRIVTGPNAFLMSQLRIGEIDLVIGRMAAPDAMTGFSFEHLYSEKLEIVVRPGHPLLSSDAFDFRAVAAYQIMIPPPDAAIRPIVDRFLVANALGPFAKVIETVSDAFGRGYVRSSDAILIMSEGVLAEDIRDGSLMRLPMDMSDTLGPVGLTTWTATPLSVQAQLFAQSIRWVVSERVGHERSKAARSI